ncbi:MAG TPA: GNAT family protein [Tissierellales bacterium]|nr:GNAT family protein [Tissierellales bacterium]
MKVLETERLILRAWGLEDIDDFFEYAKDPDVGPNAGWKPHESKEESLAILENFIEGDEVWAIVDKETGKAIGSIGAHEDDKRRDINAKMIGYVLCQDYWGQGLVPEAVNKVLEYLFNDEKVELVSCYHYPFNKRSKRVIEKCGFKFEGTLRYSSKIYNGKVYDEYCYSILRDEYIKG